jgi:hypothetical protein
VTSQAASFGLSVLPGRTAKLPISVLSSLLFECLKGIQRWNRAWPVRAVEKESDSWCQLVLKSNTPQGQHMHLRHITGTIQKPQVAALPHKNSNFLPVKCPGTPHQRGFPVLFYQGFRRIPFSGWRSDCCPHIKRGGCKDGIAERHRSRTRSDMR